jgi:hypothetical protein
MVTIWALFSKGKKPLHDLHPAPFFFFFAFYVEKIHQTKEHDF